MLKSAGRRCAALLVLLSAAAMPRMVATCFAEEGTAATTKPALSVHRIREVGLEVTCPKQWKVDVTGPKQGEENPTIDVYFMGLASTGRFPTNFVLMRREKDLGPDVDSAAHAEKAVAVHRTATMKNGGKVLEDTPLTVAGKPGRLIVVEVGQRDVAMRLLVVDFVGKGHEYKITLAGMPDDVKRAKKAALDAISSLRWITE